MSGTQSNSSNPDARLDVRLMETARADLESASADERRLLQRLGVFAGPWTLDAAEAACADDDLPRERIAALVLALSQRSCLEFDDRGGGARFWTPNPLGEACRRHFNEHRSEPEFLAVGTRFTQLVAERATLPVRRRDAGTPLDAPALERWRDEVALEHENCRRAIELASLSSATLDVAADIAIEMQDFWYPRSLYGEAMEILTPLLVARAARDDLRRDDLRQLRLHSAAFKMCWLQDRARARRHAYEALRLARGLVPPSDDPGRHGASRRLALVLNNVGLIEKELGAMDAAQRALTEAIEIAAGLGESIVENEVRLTLGLCAVARGDADVAATHLESALAFFERASDSQRASAAAHGLGLVALRRGQPLAAARSVARALLYSPFERQPEAFVHALELAGFIANDLGARDAAVQLLASADAKREALGAQPSPTEAPLRASTLAALHAAIAPARFASIWESGARLSADSARALALGLDGEFRG